MFTLTPTAMLDGLTALCQKALLTSGLGTAQSRILFSSDLCNRTRLGIDNSLTAIVSRWRLRLQHCA